MSIEAGGSFGDINRPSVSPELTEWLDAHPGTDPGSVLVLPHIPPLLGGLKSSKFIIKEPGASPDAPPDPAAVIDLASVAVPAQSLRGFANFFEAAEAQADAQYPAALLETQQAISEAQERGVAIEVSFVPDTVNHSATGYFRRLGRLAQDIGMGVVIRASSRNEGGVLRRFKRFEPPTATSVEDYWAVQAQRVRPFPREALPLEPEDTEVVAALLSLTPEPDYENRRGQDSLRWNLHTVARANTNKLREWLLQPANMTSRMLPLIKDLGYRSSHVHDINRANARMVLAKINDQEGLAALVHELQEKNGGYGSERVFMAPLGAYLRNDPGLLADTMRRVDRLVAERPDDPGEFIHLLGAIYHTRLPLVGDFVSKYLEVPPAADEYYARTVLFSTLRWLPGYIDIVQEMPDSAQQRTTLTLIQERLATLLSGIVAGQHDRVKNIGWKHASSIVADMLLKFENPIDRDLLQRHMLALFEETGSVLEPTGSMDDDTFVRQYLQYRKLYGDIPEISRLIKMSGR